MTYPEFKNASKKHLLSCECLVFLLNNSCAKKEKYILSTIYYLSGYVIETILKYSIYLAISYNRNEDISKLSSNGLTYRNNIRIHNLNSLKIELEKRHISRLINYSTNRKLFNSWDSEFRYKSSLDYTKKEILSFYEFSKLNYELLIQYK